MEVPCLAEVWVDAGSRCDRIPIDRVEGHPDGGFRLTGTGERFAAEATWVPVTDPVPHWDVRLAVWLLGGEPLDAGLSVSIRLHAVADPEWLIPGLFYGENRPAESRARYPRWIPSGSAVSSDGSSDPFAASSWSFRSDRAAMPAVGARDDTTFAVLAAQPRTTLGLTGLGFGSDGMTTELHLDLPAAESPVAYTGDATPGPAERLLARWLPSVRSEVRYRVYLAEPHAGAWRPVVRDVGAWLDDGVAVEPTNDRATTAQLAAEGLLRWHYHADRAALYETAAFDRHGDDRRAETGDRAAMHVAWLSGAPTAAALLAHGRRVDDAAARAAGTAVLDAIAANLAPCGTYWGQWSATAGWGKGWTPGPDALHSRTLAEATLFMGRALDAEASAGRPHPDWARAVASNLAFVLGAQAADGRVPSAWNGRTGEIQGWSGTAGLAWVPALVEAGRRGSDAALLEAAERAGDAYAGAVEDGRLAGAPEDVDLGPTSEDGYAAVMAYVALTEAAGDGPARPRWLRSATMAADWMLTFRYAYDVAFPAGTVLADRGFRSRGLDQASPANQHLHTYGLICQPEMVRLARLSGDGHYLDRARELFAAARQGLARHDGDLGARRGMMAERYHQTRYGGPQGSVGELSHAWCLGLLLSAADQAADLPELDDA
ncbi:MAG TPA: hypothetical protein VD763_12795 [Candidatus Saccharimonadales bacterium]|nr:hypothetical protein [Candidatus Saccharimonadales bacterium]